MAIGADWMRRYFTSLPAQRGENETLSVPGLVGYDPVWAVRLPLCRGPHADQLACLEARGERLCSVSRLMGTEEGSRGSHGASQPFCLVVRKGLGGQHPESNFPKRAASTVEPSSMCLETGAWGPREQP